NLFQVKTGPFQYNLFYSPFGDWKIVTATYLFTCLYLKQCDCFPFSMEILFAGFTDTEFETLRQAIEKCSSHLASYFQRWFFFLFLFLFLLLFTIISHRALL